MTISFGKSPLIELIAELRWQIPGMPTAGIPAPNIPPVILPNDSKLDEFFMRFGGAIYADGFQSVERLVPPNFPLMLFQPVCRFRKQEGTPHPALYQIGPGVFTANATPPYKNWDEFAPIVRRGVDALLSSRAETEKDATFLSTSVRYIDAFDSSLTQGLGVTSFFENVLGINLVLPNALTKHIASGQTHKPFLQLQLPMDSGMIMNVGIGEGLANGENAIIMDTTVTTTAPVASNVESVVSALNTARGAIHEMFLGITAPIHSLMNPSGND